MSWLGLDRTGDIAQSRMPATKVNRDRMVTISLLFGRLSCLKGYEVPKGLTGSTALTVDCELRRTIYLYYQRRQEIGTRDQMAWNACYKCSPERPVTGTLNGRVTAEYKVDIEII